MNTPVRGSEARLASPKLQKQMQEVAALSTWASCNAKDVTSTQNLMKMMYDGYHGISEGSISSCNQVIAGSGRFSGIWDAEKKINSVFPGYSDLKFGRLSINNFSDTSLRRATKSGNTLISGRNLLTKVNFDLTMHII